MKKKSKKIISCFLGVLFFFQTFSLNFLTAYAAINENTVIVQMYNQNLTNNTGTISPCFKISNTGKNNVNLNDIKIRYYYTIDIEDEQNFTCDWSSIGAANVTGKFVKMTAPVENANYYVEIGFNSATGVLTSGKSVELNTRFSKADYSTYVQQGDYSYNSLAANFQGNDKVCTYVNNSLISGTEPTGTPVANVEKLGMQMYNSDTSQNSSNISPNYRLENTGNVPIKLSDVTIRYYYTTDTDKEMRFWCDWSSVGASNVTGKFITLSAEERNSDHYCEIGFTSGAGTINPGKTIEIRTRMTKVDWSLMNQFNDYSFNSQSKDYIDWDKTPVYIGDKSNNGDSTNNNTPISVSSISFNKTSLITDIGGTSKLTSSVLPENATNKNCTWSSSDQNVITVSSDGTVTGIGVGTASITATTQDGGFTTTCSVKVQDSPIVEIDHPELKDEIVFDSELGVNIVKDQINITYKDGVTEEEALKKIDSIGGVVLGYVICRDTYFVNIKNGISNEDLNKLIDKLNNNDPIISCCIQNIIYET